MPAGRVVLDLRENLGVNSRAVMRKNGMSRATS
jgi:hypothetical protein